MPSSRKNSPVAVITGVSSGIGKGIATGLVGAGYTVFGSVRKAEDGEMLADEFGAQFHPLVFDVRDREAIHAAAATVKSALQGGVLRGLINNAGVAAFGPIECLDDRIFEDSININLFGVRNVSNAFLPMLRGTDSETPGKIINISSLSGIVNTPMNGAYCVSKHALESLADIYRRELLPSGIDVISIRSGPIQSEIWNKAKAEDDVYGDVSYRTMARSARKIMRQAEADALPVSVMANLVIDILAGRKKRVAYHLSKGAWASLFLAALPKRWADRLITGSMMSPKEHIQ